MVALYINNGFLLFFLPAFDMLIHHLPLVAKSQAIRTAKISHHKTSCWSNKIHELLIESTHFFRPPGEEPKREKLFFLLVFFG